MVVVGVPELPEQPRSPGVTTNFEPFDGVGGVAVVTNLAEPSLDGLVPPGLYFIILVASRGNESMLFSGGEAGGSVAWGPVPNVGENAPGFGGVIRVQLVRPLAGPPVQALLKGASESVGNSSREPPDPRFRRPWPALAASVLARALAKEGEDSDPRLGCGGSVGGPGVPPGGPDP